MDIELLIDQAIAIHLDTESMGASELESVREAFQWFASQIAT